MTRKTGLLLLVSIMTGCASMSDEECLLANWREVGFTDAAKGYSATRIGEHREACAGVGVQVDLDRYQEGYDVGLDQYCTAQTGFQLAANGRSYAAQCKGERFPGFADAFLVGQDAHVLKRERSDLEQRIGDYRRQMDTVLEQITEENERLELGKDRDQIRRKIRNLKDLYEDRARQIALMEQRINQIDQEVVALRSGAIE